MVDKPVYVTEVAERKPVYVGGIAMTLALFDKESQEWYSQFGRSSTFTFQKFSSPGVPFWYALRDAVEKRDETTTRDLLGKITPYAMKNLNDLTPLERWERTAKHLPEDIGGPNKEGIKKLLTSLARGRVLETMCGFNSYFGDSPKIDEVQVVDFCAEMLKRYAYPERKRIVFDMERVVRGEKLNFFKDGFFKTIGSWGTNYLSDPQPVFNEFARLLSTNGQVLILENTEEGYRDLIKRLFDPDICAKWMENAGLKPEIRKLTKIKREYEMGDYYLVRGVKKNGRD